MTERSCVEVHNETAVIDSQSEDEGADVLVGNLLNTDVPQQIQELGRRIRQRRNSAAEGQHEQAERMVKRARVELKAGEPRDNVAVPIPLVYPGSCDPRNILGVIMTFIQLLSRQGS